MIDIDITLVSSSSGISSPDTNLLYQSYKISHLATSRAYLYCVQIKIGLINQ